MNFIGSSHFLDDIKMMQGEDVVWEGGASKWGIVIQSAHFVGVILAIVLVLYITLGLPGLLFVDNPEYVPPQSKTEKNEGKVEEVVNQKNSGQSKLIPNTRLIIILLAVGLPLIIMFGLGMARLRVKNYWFVVTNERICIQSGIFSRQTVAIDIDKVASIISTHTLLDRLFKLHAVEVVHVGSNSPHASNGLVLFNPYKMYYVPTKLNLTSDLLSSWLPRDNHR